MFEMLTGLPPFYSQDVQKMYSKIMSAKVKYPDSIGPEARDLLEKVSFFFVHFSPLMISFHESLVLPFIS